MKRWQKILLGIVAVIVIAATAGLYFTSGLVEVAEGFFVAVKQKDIPKARSYLSSEFKTQTDERAMMAYLSASGLSQYKEASWSSREVSGSRGELSGTVKTESGGIVPVKISLVKESSGWKIYSLQKTAAGLQAEPVVRTIPTKPEQTTLIRQSTANFVASVNQKNMAYFRGTISSIWQQQYSVEQLNQAYKAVIDSGANWSVLNNLEPVLTPEATLEKNGVLSIKGYYPTTPSRASFEYNYVYEGNGWKLAGLHLQVK